MAWFFCSLKNSRTSRPLAGRQEGRGASGQASGPKPEALGVHTIGNDSDTVRRESELAGRITLPRVRVRDQEVNQGSRDSQDTLSNWH